MAAAAAERACFRRTLPPPKYGIGSWPHSAARLWADEIAEIARELLPADVMPDDERLTYTCGDLREIVRRLRVVAWGDAEDDR